MGRGIEKESLRVAPDCALALTPHPKGLGSPLTHPGITTDFSESQLELVTGVHHSVEACLTELTELHQVVNHQLAQSDEMMWAYSMPCKLPSDENIPLGVYGTSNIGRAKTVYRMGLAHRYGRRMQTISGIHYNWSLPGVDTAAYFGLIRNFQRHDFLLLLLFGATPVVTSDFVQGKGSGLEYLGPDARYFPYATSLRMGRLGYQSDAQAALSVSYNCLESFADSLEEALTRPYPPYESIGVRNPGGEYNQLATTLLQIENEFYSSIRAKRVIRSGERPLHALRDRGVEYVEVRLMDLNPFEAVGISANTARMVDLFLLHCLLSDSPEDTPYEIAAQRQNQLMTAMQGRKPGLILKSQGQAIVLIDWAHRILQEIQPIAQAVDQALDTDAYGQALQSARDLLDAPDELPSSRVIRDIQKNHEGSFMQFACDQSRRAKEAIMAQTLPAPVLQKYDDLARQSVLKQKEAEAEDELPFEEFRKHYVAIERLG